MNIILIFIYYFSRTVIMRNTLIVGLLCLFVPFATSARQSSGAVVAIDNDDIGGLNQHTHALPYGDRQGYAADRHALSVAAGPARLMTAFTF
ncbi:MAG: hypothetical protein DMG15_21440 [Acidobacteria bacterium]|nr:MAG: hypothetical protein DMG15_21440 [Acidobacteriota bacterium]